MNMKKILRGPIIYILLAIVAVWIGSSLITASGFREVSTQKGLELLQDDKVSSVKIVDGENRVDLTLKEADDELGKQVQFYYVTP
ncbi:MAG TPA: ATP-dependent metallopeptidase FtsH/Yme1/Tma family protein, partial [Agromyces mariniharenae]|nr:ATP-dependent metallopeptidase FtsH/Yme1/Tma family protein [Agromyces mariniharenae]